MPPPTAPPPPYALSIVLCDLLYKDSASGKTSMLGTFSQINARSFPARHPLMYLHVELTDGRGKVRLRLRLVNAEEDLPPLFEGEAEIELTDPRTVAEIGFQLQNVVFPGQGEYRFQLYGNGDLIVERRLLVCQASSEGPQEKD
jgi:hypothetical protein